MNSAINPIKYYIQHVIDICILYSPWLATFTTWDKACAYLSKKCNSLTHFNTNPLESSQFSVYMLIWLRATVEGLRAICPARLTSALVFMWVHLTCTDDKKSLLYEVLWPFTGTSVEYASGKTNAVTATPKQHTYCTTISCDRPSSSRGRDTAKLALMRQADGLYIAF